RLYMPGEENEIIPQMASIPLPNVDKTVIPDYAMRNWMYYGYSSFGFDDVIWARRIGMNNGYQMTGPLRGPHGLVSVYESQEVGEKHPEYFALFGGERDLGHRGHGTPCFSSEGFEKETINYLRFMFDEFDFPLVDIWPGDGFKPCQCEQCQGMTPSEMVWGFANRVATELYKTHPDKIVSCGAYTSYVEAPDTIEKFSPNLAVWLSNRGRPKMTDPEHWERFLGQVQKWDGKMAPGRILRLENNRAHLMGKVADPLPFPVIHPHAVARELKALKGISVGDTGEQSQRGGKWAAMGLGHSTLYTQARFLWDSQQDVDGLLNEYYSLFYGPAASAMKEAFTYAEENLAVKDTSRGAGKGDLKNVPLDVAVKFRDLLQEAKETAGDTIYGKRIDLAISALIPKKEMIAQHEAAEKALKDIRAKVPSAFGVDGADLSEAPEFVLKNRATGEESELKTSFKAGWDKDALILEITCKEPNVKNLAPASDVYSGEYVAITIQTQLHTHYILEINPDGLIMEGDPVRGWKSLAEAKPERGADFWRLTVRIPVVGSDEAEADPNHRVAGDKPTAESPWYVNIGRQIQKTGERNDEIQLFSVSPAKAWHYPAYFGKLEIK
ncbi:MAG: DUF4838 domain-containing protein, partial [Lentisphaerae bacterium]|nr:DUF4838 domain-containing protein [Lentisphaerota bacterium]